ncbi:MAG: hypothetical protein XD53_0491 [Petrotoga mobilis]|nr:MAG: hypothetical protein XD53_0491 [Petrotoga mobilis]
MLRKLGYLPKLLESIQFSHINKKIQKMYIITEQETLIEDRLCFAFHGSQLIFHWR